MQTRALTRRPARALILDAKQPPIDPRLSLDRAQIEPRSCPHLDIKLLQHVCNGGTIWDRQRTLISIRRRDSFYKALDTDWERQRILISYDNGPSFYNALAAHVSSRSARISALNKQKTLFFLCERDRFHEALAAHSLVFDSVLKYHSYELIGPARWGRMQQQQQL